MPSETVDDALKETKRAAKELAAASAKLSKRLLEKAGSAAKHPKGTAKKVGDTVAEELDAASREIERILRDL